MKEIIEKLKVICLLLGLTVACNALATAQQRPPASDRAQISAAEALSRYEKFLLATTETSRKIYLTTKAAPTAWAAGETEKAKTYAQSLLQEVDALNDDWNYGNAIHVGNLVLGLVALAADDITEAKRLLLEAGKTRGSPQLNTFGPNMLLAKGLLAKGETEVVLQYFDLCAKFWKGGEGRLDEWRAIVSKGGIPNFRANLVYRFSWRFENWDSL